MKKEHDGWMIDLKLAAAVLDRWYCLSELEAEHTQPLAVITADEYGLTDIDYMIADPLTLQCVVNGLVKMIDLRDVI